MKIFIWILACMLLISPGVQAVPIVGTTSAFFSNPIPSGPPAVFTGIGTNRITWGIPLEDSFPSSLSFSGVNVSVEIGEGFVMGIVSFSNGTIEGDTQLNMANLTVEGIFVIDESPIFIQSSPRAALFFNTRNDPDDPFASADIVTIGRGPRFHVFEEGTSRATMVAMFREVTVIASPPSAEPIAVTNQIVQNENELVLEILGFGEVIDGEGFITSNPIPEPTTCLLFAVGLIVIIGMDCRRRKKVA